ncbi:DUF6335 family protein [Pleurocapsa sp. PCC 7319]|uniref:DUF6335 family protein n=1 Tax=Pleurocapsa sp. PCC 7319 TaxID=118161 RepID=UPI0003494315|nr:DUF6335 family protein [Pleurocapsa sp. PCC 7319]
MNTDPQKFAQTEPFAEVNDVDKLGKQAGVEMPDDEKLGLKAKLEARDDSRLDLSEPNQNLSE